MKHLRLSQGYKPASFRGPVQWYVSLYSQREPIHLFRTKQQAQDWARQQAPDIVGGVDMTASLDWFPYGSNPRDTISPTRPFVDHR